MWADGCVFVPSRSFLWWYEISLCVCCMVAWGAGLICGDGGPVLLGGVGGLFFDESLGLLVSGWGGCR